MKKPLYTIIILIVTILVLSLIPATTIKKSLKKQCAFIPRTKAWIIENLHIEDPVSMVQRTLHAVFYGVLAFFLMDFFMKRGMPFRKTAAYAVIIIFGFSLFTELCQTFTAERGAGVIDIAYNMLGCAVAVVVHAARR